MPPPPGSNHAIILKLIPDQSEVSGLPAGWHESLPPFGFFINTQNWQYWHYYQLFILLDWQFPSLFMMTVNVKLDISRKMTNSLVRF